MTKTLKELKDLIDQYQHIRQFTDFVGELALEKKIEKLKKELGIVNIEFVDDYKKYILSILAK